MKNTNFSGKNPTFHEKSVFYPPKFLITFFKISDDLFFSHQPGFYHFHPSIGQKTDKIDNFLLLGKSHWKKMYFSVKCKKPRKTHGLSKQPRKAKVGSKNPTSWEKTPRSGNAISEPVASNHRYNNIISMPATM